MTIKNKQIATILVALMLLAQIAAAQHSSVHCLDDHGHYEQASHDGHDHDNHEDHQEKVDDHCQICLLTASIHFGLISEQNTLNYAAISSHNFIKNSDQIISDQKYSLHKPRAPPAFLI